MPSLEKHYKLSLKRTGKEFRQVHEWLDGKDLSISERIERHDIANIPKFLPVIEEKFGNDGVKEFVQHIKDDYEKDIAFIALNILKKLKFW